MFYPEMPAFPGAFSPVTDRRRLFQRYYFEFQRLTLSLKACCALVPYTHSLTACCALFRLKESDFFPLVADQCPPSSGNNTAVLPTLAVSQRRQRTAVHVTSRRRVVFRDKQPLVRDKCAARGEIKRGFAHSRRLSRHIAPRRSKLPKLSGGQLGYKRRPPPFSGHLHRGSREEGHTLCRGSGNVKSLLFYKTGKYRP